MTSEPGLIPVVNLALPPGTHVLTVGAGMQYSTVAAAINASRDGDVIRVNAGTYTNDFATITHKITIEGMGGRVSMVATVAPPNRKGILVVDNDVTIKNLDFSGSAISAADGGNGAGIRYEGGQLVLINSSFIGNQNGVMGNPVIAGLTNTVTIDHSLFSGNGSGTGYTHNFYIGAVSSVTATNSIFEKAKVGHEFKSRALINVIQNNIFRDTPTGTASYSIDLPNGGNALIQNNLIDQGPLSQNSAIIAFGEEGGVHAGSSLTVTGNTILNHLNSPSASAIWNATSTVTASVTGNSFFGLLGSQIMKGRGIVSGSTMLGGTGNDTLDGGTGAQIMVGGPGNDTYVVNDAGDVVTEKFGEGTDLVKTSLASYTLGSNVENLTFIGSGNFIGTGNALANSISGGAGIDTLTGGGGNDVFNFTAGKANGDTITDFVGSGSLAGDTLRFLGYGTAAQGATLTQQNATDWRVKSASGYISEIIRFSNGASVHPTDVTFQ